MPVMEVVWPTKTFMKDTNSRGSRIASLRKELGYTQADLAVRLEGFNRDHVTKLESDKVKHPKRELIAQLVEVLNTTYEWLELGKGEPHPIVGNTDGSEGIYIEQLLSAIDTENSEALDLLRNEILRILEENKQLTLQNRELKKNIVQAIRRINNVNSKDK